MGNQDQDIVPIARRLAVLLATQAAAFALFASSIVALTLFGRPEIFVVALVPFAVFFLAVWRYMAAIDHLSDDECRRLDVNRGATGWSTWVGRRGRALHSMAQTDNLFWVQRIALIVSALALVAMAIAAI